MKKGLVFGAATVVACIAGALAFHGLGAASHAGHRPPTPTEERDGQDPTGGAIAERARPRDDPPSSTVAEDTVMERRPPPGPTDTVRPPVRRGAPALGGSSNGTAGGPAGDPVAHADGVASPDPTAPPPHARTEENNIADTPEGREMQGKMLGQLKPILSSCYQDELARAGSSEPDVLLSFDITIDPSMGAVVHSVDVEADAGTVDPHFIECLQQTVDTIAPFPATGQSSSTMVIPLSFHR